MTIENYEMPVYRINSKHGQIIGKSPEMLRLFSQINTLAQVPTTVLLRGDSGTGKELFAKALHYNKKQDKPTGNFVAVNCAGIPSELLETELFGHVKGSFTGADYEKPGMMQMANNGTIFLDEIGDMPIHMQAKILRALQERIIYKVGGTKSERVNVRIVAATHKNLEEAIEKGTFREDLYYRLNVVKLQIPPLSERVEDLPHLISHFVTAFNTRYNANVEGVTQKALEVLEKHHWKGNIRELENVVERSFIARREGHICSADITFDGSLPKIDIQIAEEVSKDPQSAAKAWYVDGVLPMNIVDIQKLQGARGIRTLKKAMTDSAYSIALGTGERRSRVVFLTPDNLHFFFKDTGSEDCQRVLSEIKASPLNEVVSKPFALYTMAMLAKLKGLASVDSPHSYFKTAESKDVIQITGNLRAFILTEDNCYKVAGVVNRDKQIESMRQDMKTTYHNFINWTPR